MISLCLSALPKAPGNPVVTERTATSITLTWDSGNPEPVSYYIIQVCNGRHIVPHLYTIINSLNRKAELLK